TARLTKNPSGATKRASARSCARLAKAASISPIVAAVRIIWICSPIAGAACCTSRKVVSATEALDGFTRTAIRTAFGTKSCRSRSRFAVNSALKKLIPVALPPGRARLATRPRLIGPPGRQGTSGRAGCGDHGHLSADQIGHQCRQTIVLPLQPVVLDRYVLAFDVAGLVEAFAERA